MGVDGREHRDGQARQQAGFAAVDLVEVERAVSGSDAPDGQVSSVDGHFGAQCPCELDGSKRIAAGAVAAQV